MSYTISGLGLTDTERRDAARALYTEGLAAFDARRFMEAKRLFLEAEASYSSAETSPVVWMALARTYRMLEDWPLARAYAERYLAALPAGPLAESARVIVAYVSALPSAPPGPSASSGKPVREPDLELPTVEPAPPRITRTLRGASVAVGTWVAVGAGALALAGLAWVLMRRRSVRVNRLRRLHRRQRRSAA